MATVATPSMRALAIAWTNAIPGATLSGIVGDLAHQAEGGYHISRQDNSPDDYSVQLPPDKLGDPTWASAIDMSMPPTQMKLVTSRLLASAKDLNDPRLDVCREFYGTLDGITVTGWDTYYGVPATSDDSHLWHVHVSFLRAYANDPAAMNAVLSIVTGQPYEEDDMPQGMGPIQLPNLPKAQESYSIWPVNQGAAGFGPAWLTIWGDMLGRKAALRIAITIGDNTWKFLGTPPAPGKDPVLTIESGKTANIALPDGTRGISVTRIPVDTADDCAPSVSMSIEYGRR